MRLPRREAHIVGRRWLHTGICWEDLTERNHLEYLGVDERIILNWILQKWSGEAWNGLTWLAIGTGGGACKCGNGNFGFLQHRDILG
jgi:hypothetical protein